MKTVVYVDLHVIQSVPPSCLNRDDTGSPKTAIYGGARRARVSSQAWKRTMRLMFKERFNEADLGARTLLIFGMIADEIIKLEPDTTRDKAMKLAQDVLKVVDIDHSAKNENKVDALFFLGTQQAQKLAGLALGNLSRKDAKKEIIQALNDNPAVDIALFGRMVAANPLLNCDASAQVAHAISTHRTENEYDYYVAVDDLKPKDSTGAGMIGTVEYNSATLYRYATVAVHCLFEQLAKNETALSKAISEFARAFIISMPTGKQNTFAANTIPDAVLATIRTDRPITFVGAYETPVRASDGEGLIPASMRALVKYAQDIYTDFCPTPKISYTAGQYLHELGEYKPFDELCVTLGNEATKLVAPKA